MITNMEMFIGHRGVYSVNIFCDAILSARVRLTITNMEMFNIGHGSGYSVSIFCDVILLAGVRLMVTNINILLAMEACIQWTYLMT